MLLTAALVPTFLIGFIQMQIVQSSLEKDFELVKARLAERTAKNATEFLKGYSSLLSTIGELDEISRFKKEDYVSVMKRVLESHPVIAEMDLYDANGQWIYGMERIPGAVASETRPAELMPFVQEKVEQLGQFYGAITPVSGYPGIELYVPIRKRGTRAIVGYLRSVMSLLALSESLAEIKIGKSAELFIVDFRKRLIAHSNYKKVFRESPMEVDPVLMDRIGKLGVYQTWSGRLNFNDKREVVAALYKLDDQPWVAVSFQERWEAFVVMIEMRQRLVEVILVGILTVLIFAILFANRISQPIRTLTRAVRQIVATDFVQPVTDPLPKPNNEIGELATAFEAMSKVLANRTHELIRAQEELKRFNLELEARVEARTRELKATQEELIKQERLAALGQMASVVGHELRNPLAVINNSTYVIKSRLAGDKDAAAGVDPKILRHVSIIEGELHVANQIISEILTFARTREIQPREIDLHEFLEEVISRITVPEKTSIVKRYAHEQVRVRADPDEIRQAVRNLVINAFDAMPNGGELTVATSVNKSHCILSISDTGTGITPETIAKIFTPFFTTKSKGTGLGLAVVKKVLDRHNGELAVDSAVGKGTTFHLKFPFGGASIGGVKPEEKKAVG